MINLVRKRVEARRSVSHHTRPKSGDHFIIVLHKIKNPKSIYREPRGCLGHVSTSRMAWILKMILFFGPTRNLWRHSYSQSFSLSLPSNLSWDSFDFYFLFMNFNGKPLLSLVFSISHNFFLQYLLLSFFSVLLHFFFFFWWSAHYLFIFFVYVKW